MNKTAVAGELVRLAKMMTADGEKRYNTMTNVGRAKYVVNYHDGIKTHKDGSPFYDIALFSNEKAFSRFIRSLEQDGYAEE